MAYGEEGGCIGTLRQLLLLGPRDAAVGPTDTPRRFPVTVLVLLAPLLTVVSGNGMPDVSWWQSFGNTELGEKAGTSERS